MRMDVPAIIKQYFGRLYSNLLPTPCLLCGDLSQQDYICPSCHADLPLLQQACPHCAMPSPNSLLCGQCLQHAPERDASFSLYRYQYPVDRFITNFKFHHQLYLGYFLAQQLALKLQEQQRPLPDLLIPIPLHPKRLKQRGYNQALEITRYLAKSLYLPYEKHALKRVKNTVPQTSLSYSQRQKNLQQAFEVCKKDLPQHVVLIDDVLTTGHTADMAAKSLRKVGVKTIELWTIARAIRHDSNYG